ncbi:MAG: hypothetical protein ACW98F_04835 [Candidatus Hodarchaeales archaeon]|jgi:hypothetical protein
MAIEILGLVGFFIFSLEIGVSFFLIYSLWVRWRETRIPVIGILIGLYVVFIAFVGFEFLFYILNIDNPVQFYREEGNIVNYLFPLYGGLSSGVFLLFVEFFRKDRVSPVHASIYGVFLGAFLLNMIYPVLFPDIMSKELIFPEKIEAIYDVILTLMIALYTTNFPAAYFVGYVIITTIWSLQKIKRQITFKKQKVQAIMLQLSIIFFFAVPLIIVVSARFLEQMINPDLHIFLQHLAPHISVIVGSWLIYKAYVSAPLGLLQFHRLKKLMVINKSGLLLYSYEFLPGGNSGSDRDLLFSGGVLAVLNLFTEMIETTDVKMIQFQKEIIMLSNSENFLTFIIADHTSRFLWSALDAFTRIFNLKYGSEAEELTVVPKHVFEGTFDLVKLAFGRE